ncbi:5-methyltetrahydropteroyltriglutamate--homocysteine S-methyltransferase [Roseomonas frigidaquae]|uniref:5-methyltetrahydropteroyltriglutamate--homocysteine methyltransferase n=1 Tax=Falsiroseomonas frigidaquae TaxID=487318 RepID=A0ABX1F1D6_9PROT|nr:5-methyltetrahydropteroyltriglutamate--homocysteine S-methyltransferase [Falsiroseomonas frigidaquae]NKE46139.1 5-methyltetrahydropteroyltriglutamate--homocysteine S-methyltransferase [Falsiroseomonas frigidaquae]
MTIAANLGYPRIGPRRELKTALESFWSGKSTEAELLATAEALRAGSRALQQGSGINHVPSTDFTLYDHVLDTACALGVVPDGYGWSGEGPVSLATYFALARGARGTEAEQEAGIRPGATALEMTKWFDTNYHYLVPRLTPETRFQLTRNRWADAVREGLALGTRTRPVLLGPVSFLLLSKAEDVRPLDLLPALLPVYAEVLRGIAEAGATWVQIDEPCLVTDLPPGAEAAYATAYHALAEAAPGLDILLATYFGALRENLPFTAALPVAGLHLDLVRAPDQLADALAAWPADRWLSLGLVDGRNVWRTDLRQALGLAQHAAAGGRGKRLMVAPSCSLLHVPHSLKLETALDPALARRLAFANEKLAEVVALARGLDEGEAAIAPLLKASDAARAEAQRQDPAVAARLGALTPEMAQRRSPYAQRAEAQHARFNLPKLPVTSIGSWPQTAEVRALRARLARGEMTQDAHDAAMEALTAEAVRWQEEIGVDVPVHGEFERNDMVKYFGEQLAGYAFTKHGWVQSYGSRCVAPPIIWGDVSRPHPMTVRWSAFAQSLTKRPMKGMLTGPVTMLNWSFVRDDLPRDVVCRQIALAIRDEVADLEAAGIGMIQIDEPAFREGLPLRESDRAEYLRWAVECFRLSASVVGDATQIHTHMCYSEFNDIIAEIAAMDADVISIETARSDMELLAAFEGFAYPNEIGPGVWDIHSPRVPDAAEMVALLRRAAQRVPAGRLWANPDCGCKTRGWAEVRPAMANLVAAARTLRAELV